MAYMQNAPIRDPLMQFVFVKKITSECKKYILSLWT